VVSMDDGDRTEKTLAVRSMTPRSSAPGQWIQDVGSMSEMSCIGSFQTYAT
jgi:hypothetical protein